MSPGLSFMVHIAGDLSTANYSHRQRLNRPNIPPADNLIQRNHTSIQDVATNILKEMANYRPTER